MKDFGVKRDLEDLDCIYLYSMCKTMTDVDVISKLLERLPCSEMQGITLRGTPHYSTVSGHRLFERRIPYQNLPIFDLYRMFICRVLASLSLTMDRT